MKVLIAAGGTGGHLYPAQQLAELLEKDLEVVFAGHHLAHSPYFQRDRFRFCEILSAPLNKRLFVPFIKGTIGAIRLLQREKPDVVVGFGSFHTAPVLFASVLLRKKIILFEANRTRGKVISLFAPFATKIAVQFPQKNRAKEVQVRLFPWILKSGQIDKQSAIQTYGLDPQKKTFLIFGGSQGAQFFNEIMPEVSLDGQIIHLAGNEKAANETAKKYASRGIRALVKAFEPNMVIAYAAADFAICRSGAATVAELIRYQVPALLIPYPHAYGHQQVNGDFLLQLGGAKMVLQQDATPEAIEKLIQECDLVSMEVALRSAEAQNQGMIGLDELVRQCFLNRSI